MSGSRALVLAALLLPCACSESLYAPPPQEVPCGGNPDHPCALRCDLDCPTTAVEMAAACMQSLQGSFDAARTRCSFTDGSQLRLARSAPVAGSDLSLRSWQLELRRGGDVCLAVNAEPLPWLIGALSSTTEVQAPGGRYRQRVELAAAVTSGDDAGPPLPSRVEITCPDGGRFEAQGSRACADCPDADCRHLPLVQLLPRWNGDALDFELRAGPRVTPLFSCR